MIRIRTFIDYWNIQLTMNEKLRHDRAKIDWQNTPRKNAPNAGQSSAGIAVVEQTSTMAANMSRIICCVRFVRQTLSPHNLPAPLMRGFSFATFPRLFAPTRHFYPVPYPTPSKAQDSRSNLKPYLLQHHPPAQSYSACRQS